MPAEVDKAIYAKRPAWHGLGAVKEDGYMTAEECLAVLDPSGAGIKKGRVTITVTMEKDGKLVDVDVPCPDLSGVVDFDSNENTWRALSVMAKDYPALQRQEQFLFMDTVIGQVDGAHYEAAVNLRKGKQTVLTAYLGDYVLDKKGIADKNKKFLWGFNSWNGSWALRLKFGNFRVECANMAAMALRGSTDANVIGGEWSTRHTTNMMSRVSEAQSVLGLWHTYDAVSQAQEEHMIHTVLDDNTFQRVITGLCTAVNPKTDQVETDKEAVEQIRTVYELSAAGRDIIGTVWGGFNAVTQHHDWAKVLRGSKTASIGERRFINQIEDPTGIKQRAWDSFWNVAAEAKPFVMPDLATA